MGSCGRSVTEKTLESRNMYLYRFGLDGKLAEGMNVPVDQEKWAAFWS